MTEYKSSIRAHGKTQLELKNRYPLDPKENRAFYTLETYMFTPAQLGITAKRYGVDHFFSDVKSHTRFSISYIPLSRLMDPDCAISPIARIGKFLDKANLSSDIDENRILYELRTLANLFSAEMKATHRLLSGIAKEGTNPTIITKIELFLKETETFLHVFRALHARFMEPSITERLRTALRWTDESISLSAEKMLFYLHGMLRQEALVEKITVLMEHEQYYRKEMGYPSVITNGTEVEVEGMLYRESILKKWSQTVLYMSSEETGTNRKIGHMLAAVAAATAMVFSVVATFFANNLFPSYSVPWAFIVVVSYMLKDRIKEILRGILVKIMPRFIADRTERLVDRAVDRHVGKTRSMVRIISPEELPQNVRTVRQAGSNPFRSILPPENVIHFRKEVVIDSRKLLREHSRVEAITEIIRLKLDRFQEEMDASKKLLRTWYGGEAQAIKGKRVYHINLILVLSSKGEEEQLFRYRLILTHQGIQRIEEVPT
ncbi:hypothetical protein [Sediminispirochaeta smaragdinae]|jgi:hypothetical protein|uniref:Uncharacterized protein n=1 Tax=Sediminispirochaeta smaragdinae (strain DSM 11293 / JCM 15392 / SEBR 4228) TaxID=573413 RepID=E1R975_SEDSS|nr:hypothetical protein [Sediminispirochaeta smaragdinae]ADK83044.1 hypothetical protein Spirs_3959 [Sediminispirochaeta smaragdinae DSM 11293]